MAVNKMITRCKSTFRKFCTRILSDAVAVSVLTIFAIVEYILTVFPPPHDVGFRVPCRFARESHVCRLPDNHVGACVLIHYGWGNCNKNRNCRKTYDAYSPSYISIYMARLARPIKQ